MDSSEGGLFLGYTTDLNNGPPLPVWAPNRGALRYQPANFTNPDLTNQNLVTIIPDVGQLSGQQNGTFGIIVDAARMWISGDSYYANSPGVYTFGLNMQGQDPMPLLQCYVPGAAPATPLVVLADSGWVEFPGGFNASAALSGGTLLPPTSIELQGGPGVGGAWITGTLSVVLAWHVE